MERREKEGGIERRSVRGERKGKGGGRTGRRGEKRASGRGVERK